MIMRISTLHGKVYVNDTGVQAFSQFAVRDGRKDSRVYELIPSTPPEIISQLLQETGDVICGLDSLPLCIMIDTKYFVSPLAVQIIPVLVGPQSMTFTASLPCLNRILGTLRYMGMQDYNNNVPFIAPANKAGCAVTQIPDLETELLKIELSDNNKFGCISEEAKVETKTMNIQVKSVDMGLVISAPESVDALESYPVVFSDGRCEEVAMNPQSKCGSIQVLTRDNGDLTVLERYFRMFLTVKHGTLTMQDKTGITRC
jgi:hypothetical protein